MAGGPPQAAPLRSLQRASSGAGFKQHQKSSIYASIWTPDLFDPLEGFPTYTFNMKRTVLVLLGKETNVLQQDYNSHNPPRTLCDWLCLEKGFREGMQKIKIRLKRSFLEGCRGGKMRWWGGHHLSSLCFLSPIIPSPNIRKERSRAMRNERKTGRKEEPQNSERDKLSSQA